MQKLFANLTVSGYWLIAVNVLPLLGVLFFDWSTFEIVLVYWCENVLIGAINVLKMACRFSDMDGVNPKHAAAREDMKRRRPIVFALLSRLVPVVINLIPAPFFILHYGMFCMVHGVLITGLLDGQGSHDFFGSPLEVYSEFVHLIVELGLIWVVLGLAVSHLFSFFVNYLGRGEYRRVTGSDLMTQPYKRIVVLHVAIIFGAFAIVALGSPLFLLLILIVGKTALDLKMHLVQRTASAAH